MSIFNFRKDTCKIPAENFIKMHKNAGRRKTFLPILRAEDILLSICQFVVKLLASCQICQPQYQFVSLVIERKLFTVY